MALSERQLSDKQAIIEYTYDWFMRKIESGEIVLNQTDINDVAELMRNEKPHIPYLHKTEIITRMLSHYSYKTKPVRKGKKHYRVYVYEHRQICPHCAGTGYTPITPDEES